MSVIIPDTILTRGSEIIIWLHYLNNYFYRYFFSNRTKKICIKETITRHEIFDSFTKKISPSKIVA